MELIKPTLEYARFFLEAEQELEAAGDATDYDGMQRPKTMEDYIALLEQHSRGENLPPTWIPYSTFWLIDNGEYIGQTNIRHTLNDKLRTIGGHIGYTIRPSKRRQGYGTHILKLALRKAHEIGINNVLVTCDETNIASKKIIEANGGIFEKTFEHENNLPKRLLYWFK